mmetsp:Transcript_79568/g.177965  ORF Transcript_79568/g.177965 Transcript_79568/m.177965 type:complete len:579 (+) Transcript_79568:150-1886(+)
MRLDALLLTHGVERAGGGAATTTEGLGRLPQVFGDVDAPVLDLLGLLVIHLAVLAVPARLDIPNGVEHLVFRGRQLREALLEGARDGRAAASAGALAGRSGLARLEAVEEHGRVLLALRAREDELDGGEGSVDLLLLGAAAHTLATEVARLHVEASEVGAVQLAALVLLEGVHVVLDRVLAGRVPDLPEELARLLGGILGLRVLALTKVAAGDEQQGAGLAAAITKLLVEGLRLARRLHSVSVGLRHKLGVGEDVERTRLHGLVADALVARDGLLRGPHGLTRVALPELDKEEVRLGDQLGRRGLASLVAELLVGREGLLGGAESEAGLVLHEAQLRDLGPGRSLATLVPDGDVELGSLVEHLQSPVEVAPTKEQVADRHDHRSLALALARADEALQSLAGHLEGLLSRAQLHVRVDNGLEGHDVAIDALLANVLEELAGGLRHSEGIRGVALLQEDLRLCGHGVRLTLLVAERPEERHGVADGRDTLVGLLVQEVQRRELAEHGCLLLLIAVALEAVEGELHGVRSLLRLLLLEASVHDGVNRGALQRGILGVRCLREHVLGGLDGLIGVVQASHHL